VHREYIGECVSVDTPWCLHCAPRQGSVLHCCPASMPCTICSHLHQSKSHHVCSFTRVNMGSRQHFHRRLCHPPSAASCCCAGASVLQARRVRTRSRGYVATTAVAPGWGGGNKSTHSAQTLGDHRHRVHVVATQKARTPWEAREGSVQECQLAYMLKTGNRGCLHHNPSMPPVGPCKSPGAPAAPRNSSSVCAHT
jgi:hypothetical protein